MAIEIKFHKTGDASAGDDDNDSLVFASEAMNQLVRALFALTRSEQAKGNGMGAGPLESSVAARFCRFILSLSFVFVVPLPLALACVRAWIVALLS
uniref:Uncharacterized protein n=1 Tax=Arundo donax TaxID=35708 RepID=A0A0A9HL58_ARUDO